METPKLLSKEQIRSSLVTSQDDDFVKYEIRVGDLMRTEYQSVKNKIEEFENCFTQSLNIILNHLKYDPVKKLNYEPMLLTPSASARKTRRKRPAPNSSSTNKILVHRVKRLSKRPENTFQNDNVPASGGSKKSTNRKLFNSNTNLKGPKSNADPYMELMTELSISENKNQTSIDSADDSTAGGGGGVNKENFISKENSLLKKISSFANLSKVDNSTNSVKTRSQTRMAGANATPLSKNAKTAVAMNGRTQINSTPQAKGKVSNAKGSGTGKHACCTRSSSFNTPKRNVANNHAKEILIQQPQLIDAKTLSQPSTPSMTLRRRKEQDEETKKRLLMSEDKKKKADVNRQAYLDSKKMALKCRSEEREKRLARFKEKQLQVEHAKLENLKKKMLAPVVKPPHAVDPSVIVSSALHHNLAPATGTQNKGTSSTSRELERRKKLNNLATNQANPTTTTTTSKCLRSNSSNNLTKNGKTSSRKLQSQNSSSKLMSNGKKGNSANNGGTKMSKSNMTNDDTLDRDVVSNMKKLHIDKAQDLLTSDESVDDVQRNGNVAAGNGVGVEIKMDLDESHTETPIVLPPSPIEKNQTMTIGGNIQNSTFVSNTAQNVFKPVLNIANGNETYIEQYNSTMIGNGVGPMMQGGGGMLNSSTAMLPPNTTANGTFVKNLNSTFNKTISKLVQQSTPSRTGSGAAANVVSTYEMTPPPKPMTSYSTYDISAMVDSDDEEAIAIARSKADTKPIPRWAVGKEFVKLIQKQFSVPAEEFQELAKSIFSNKIILPVPLEEMGLSVKSSYAVRSSSVSWNDAKLAGLGQ